MKPLVSILMATFNGEPFLGKQLDSILRQTYKNLEIIIQDDGSTDNTLSVLQHYSEKDPRITYYSNPKNLGINKNFFRLMAKATGQYIAFSDQDDVWETEKIDILVHRIGDKSLIYTDSTLISEDGSKMGKTLINELDYAPQTGKYLLELLRKNTISGHACLIDSSIKDQILKFQNWDFGPKFVYDQLVGTVCSFNEGVTFHNQPLTCHRIHSNNNQNKELLERSGKHIHNIPKPSFVQRRKNRVLKKIKQASIRLHLIGELLPTSQREAKTGIPSAQDLKQQFNRSFFNRSLYQVLIQLGFSNEDARETAKGKLHYIFFGIF